MADHRHHYEIELEWTGAGARGTTSYQAYGRDHVLRGAGKPELRASSDPAFFGGDHARWNPEELLVAALSSCHMLWYLALCAEAGVRVVTYADAAEGWMDDLGPDGGQFARVLLRPRIKIAAGSDLELAERLHHRAHAKCYIARSVNFPVELAPEIAFAPGR